MIIRLKRFSTPNPNPLKAPKPKILGEKSAKIVSKNGTTFQRRLDEDIHKGCGNLNFGKELRELEDEKRKLSNLKMENI